VAAIKPQRRFPIKHLNKISDTAHESVQNIISGMQRH